MIKIREFDFVESERERLLKLFESQSKSKTSDVLVLTVLIHSLLQSNDNWKKRAMALENALGRVTPRCMWCALDSNTCGHYNPPRPHGMLRSDNPTFYCRSWEFDVEKFLWMNKDG